MANNSSGTFPRASNLVDRLARLLAPTAVRQSEVSTGVASLLPNPITAYTIKVIFSRISTPHSLDDIYVIQESKRMRTHLAYLEALAF